MNRCQRVRRDEVIPSSQSRDETDSSFSSAFSWSSSSVTTVTSSSSSGVQVHRQEQFELREVCLLQPIINNVYQESGDDGPEPEVESGEISVPREGGLRPFNPPLVSSPIPLDPVSEAREDSSAEDIFSTPVNRISIISNSYRSELAQTFQAQFAQDLSVSGDYDISDLWPEVFDQNTVEQASKYLRQFFFFWRVAFSYQEKNSFFYTKKIYKFLCVWQKCVFKRILIFYICLSLGSC